jgi:nucleotide-binding universal stress UspA family protein
MQANTQEGQMSAKFVVGYDGSDASQRALDFAVGRVKLQGGMVVLVHVLEWSPYSFLSASELEERHKRRKEELERAEKALISPVLNTVRAGGVEAEGVIRYGHIADTICKIAEEIDAVQIVIGRNGHTQIGSRIFGSVAGHLAQAAPVPCTIVP